MWYINLLYLFLLFSSFPSSEAKTSIAYKEKNTEKKKCKVKVIADGFSIKRSLVVKQKVSILDFPYNTGLQGLHPSIERIRNVYSKAEQIVLK